MSAQLNFSLNQAFTWHDRPLAAGPRTTAALWLRSLGRRWLTFHACIAGTISLNLAVFAVASSFVPTLIAGALGIGAAAFLNFLLNHYVTFRPGSPRSQTHSQPPVLGAEVTVPVRSR